MIPLYQELPFTSNSYINFYKEDLPHFIVPWHYHPEIEIMYILEGTGTRFVGDHIDRYQEGDVCMVGPKLPHEWRNDDEFFKQGAGLKASCLCLFFLKDIFEENLIRLPEMQNIRQLIERSRRGIKFMGKSRDAIGSFIQRSVSDTGATRIINFISLLEMMATTDEYELLASVGFTESVNSSDFERFDKVYQYMMKNFTKPIKLEEVASLVGLTPNAFCRYFRGRTKKTFVQYLNDIRIGHAKKLLIEGRMKISTLSMESGFNNLSNFIEQFKRSTQMSPSEYQKKFGVKNQKVI
ncbi:MULTISPECIES: AraC family transcriptional regulator [Parabacteroides]|jgi:transcriptional regulator|uniref:AraC-like DNA-binding protein n=1 Tax=Parabacteroides faecis TaxID=1217282 RepID=A0ABR6KU59_9BACT|nr:MULTISPECIES: AraC family transcriptional regulator [Parabacteroides]MBB4625012.1 AraC-like DNA-binding protein [Parabacteroides faecis]MBC8619115.1 AraC family transcriptional regulator [Parabacteroides faecis]MCS2894298.1 AraC family transcriptional regulator [Parabacteroides faecis]RHR37808.1 AraC family transcriptional regulator [Parabacteroides sp. AF18-52]RHR99890.1 AraC family transcriptional regulator [Parabacteroides sp. AF14-59]